MNPEYYEGIVLSTIDKLQKENDSCVQSNIVKYARLSNKTIIKAIKRLEGNGRLRVIRGGQRYHYKILDPPNDFDLMVLAIHLESRNKNNRGENSK